VVHTGGGRRRGKSRPRILYWFRTPPGVRIGRSALDESAIKLIEEHNPDVEFDWTRILKGQDAPVEQAPPQQDRRGRPRREFPPRGAGSRPPADAPLQQVEALSTPVASEASAALPGTEQPFAGADVEGSAAAEPEEMWGRPEAPPADDRAAIEDLLSDETSPPAVAGPTVDGAPASAAQARLGSEALSRLRARHAEVLARISEVVTDPVRRDELKSTAERLNPDTWVTDAEVTGGLESYETVFESLRSVVGRRPRRRRRSERRPGPGASGATADADPPDSGGEATEPEDVGDDL
jgi:hypothetical protein